MVEEVAADIEVGPAAHARPVGGGARRHTFGLEAQLESVGEPLPQPLHRAERTVRVGERDLAPRALRVAEPPVGQEVLDPAGQAGERADNGCLDDVHRQSARRELDEEAAFGVVGLAERHRQRRAGVVRRRAHLLTAVEVTERDVGEAVEDVGMDGPQPPERMSRSESLAAHPVTKVCAMTTAVDAPATRPPAGRRDSAAARTVEWVGAASRAVATRRGSR